MGKEPQMITRLASMQIQDEGVVSAHGISRLAMRGGMRTSRTILVAAVLGDGEYASLVHLYVTFPDLHRADTEDQYQTNFLNSWDLQFENYWHRQEL